MSLRHGIYSPVVTIFDRSTENIDQEAQAKHAIRLVKAGLVGLVVMGSNGEAVHLSRSERTSLLWLHRSSLDKAGYSDIPVIAGCSDNGVRTTLELCSDAAKAGASYAMILPPSYYKAAMTEEVIYQYFINVADQSPIPILIYNYPGAAAGIDLNSDIMIKIAAHPNVQGVKFTCASTGKITRVSAATNAITPANQGSGFLTAGGLADIEVQTFVSGGSAVIAGTANVFPKLCVHVWNLCAQGKVQEAMELQKVLARADWAISKAGISGTKAALEEFFSYGGLPRKPLAELSPEYSKALAKDLAEAAKLEASV